MTIIINGQEVNLSDRKEQCTTFGRQFKADASASEMIKMCESRIAAYQQFIGNLDELKQSMLVRKANENKDELKALLGSMGEEERSAFINSLNN